MLLPEQGDPLGVDLAQLSGTLHVHLLRASSCFVLLMVAVPMHRCLRTLAVDHTLEPCSITLL